MHLGIIFFRIWLFGGVAYQGGEEAEVGRRALMCNLCLMSHRLYDAEKPSAPGSGYLNFSFSVTQQKVFC